MSLGKNFIVPFNSSSVSIKKSEIFGYKSLVNEILQSFSENYESIVNIDEKLLFVELPRQLMSEGYRVTGSEASDVKVTLIFESERLAKHYQCQLENSK